MIQRIKNLLHDEDKKEVLSYLIFGLLTTAVSWFVYFTMTALLKPESYETGSVTQKLILHGSQWTSWLLSVLFAFFTNKRYVFKSNEKKAGAWKEFFSFASARLIGYFLFDALLYDLSIYRLGIDHRITKILMNILVVIFNYFASKYVIFRKSRKKDENV